MFNTTVRRTHKTCKCGQHIVIAFTEYVESGSAVSMGVEAGGYFKSGGQWHNDVYCSACQRIHDLTKFGKYTPQEISQEAARELLAALEALFENCEMIHRHWGEGSNMQEADAAVAAARAAIKRAKGE